jgi:hypothetical protein
MSKPNEMQGEDNGEAQGRNHAKEVDPTVHRDGKRVGVDRESTSTDKDLDIE